MRQVLFHLPLEIAGVPFFGFGWMLLAWALGSLVFLGWLHRHNALAEGLQQYGLLLLVIGAVIAYGMPLMEGELHGAPIRGYGVMLMLGVVSGVSLALYEARREGIDPDAILSLTFWMFVGGISGARLFFVVQYRETFYRETHWETMIEMLKVTEGGLVVYGSLIGGAIAGWLCIRKLKLPWRKTADLLAPGMVLGLALGRLGCFLNGCCYGGVCDSAWSVSFPPKSPPYQHQLQSGEFYGFRLTEDEGLRVGFVRPGGLADQAKIQVGDRILAINGYPAKSLKEAGRWLASGRQLHLEILDRETDAVLSVTPPARSLPVHPTQVYSSISAAFLCLLLWAYYPYRRRFGEVFLWMLTLYSIVRFLLEAIRTDEGGQINTGLTISQLVSVGIMLLAIAEWVMLLRLRVIDVGTRA